MIGTLPILPNDLLFIHPNKDKWSLPVACSQLLGGGEVDEPDYQRAIEIIRNCLCYIHDAYGAYSSDCYETLQKFRQMDLSDEEIAYFGWEYLFDVEDEEDCE